MKKKDEEKRMEAHHQMLLSRIIASADGEAGLLHEITKPSAGRGGMQIQKEEWLLEKAARVNKAMTGVECDGFHAKSCSGFDKRKRRRSGGILGAVWEMAAEKLAQHCFS